jgi:hypothetical protein
MDIPKLLFYSSETGHGHFTTQQLLHHQPAHKKAPTPAVPEHIDFRRAADSWNATPFGAVDIPKIRFSALGRWTFCSYTFEFKMTLVRIRKPLAY